jgi:tetratricopeptide (TPR) repeat protein
VKDVLQKLSWYYYLKEDQVMAEKYRAMILKKGGLDTEADKQALKEAKSSVWPHKLLLKARLLNDGGYYWEALNLLMGKRYTDFSKPQDQTEFVYRAARLYDDLGDKEKAIDFYKQAIALGENRTEYFAARAALHIGNIYEKRNEKKTAISWYQRCLDMEDHDFKNSLDQRAKAGIARCKGE